MRMRRAVLKTYGHLMPDRRAGHAAQSTTAWTSDGQGTDGGDHPPDYRA